jgi:hypothetical protein
MKEERAFLILVDDARIGATTTEPEVRQTSLVSFVTEDGSCGLPCLI